MSIIIRGMEMPEKCLDCPFVSYDSDICTLMDEDIPIYGAKPSWCPIVPLPEGHGRLIDADSFKADCLAATKDAKPDYVRHEDWLKSCAVTMAFCRDIEERPTIVPAEGTDNDSKL